METSRMSIENLKIINARYCNSSRTLIYAEAQDPSGEIKKLNINAPANNQRGIDPLFDKIADTIGLQKMSDEFKKVEQAHFNKQQYIKQKEQSELERKKMLALLEKKAETFENPIVEKINNRTIRTAIRKAKNEQQLNYIVVAALISMFKENNSLEEVISAITGEEFKTPESNHGFLNKETVQTNE